MKTPIARELAGEARRVGERRDARFGVGPARRRRRAARAVEDARRLHFLGRRHRRDLAVARREDGRPLTGWEVTASVAGARTNEPTGAMLARRGRVDERGRFELRGVPRGVVQVRIVALNRLDQGPPTAGHVVAGQDVDTRGRDRVEVELVAPTTPKVHGEARTPDGAPLASLSDRDR